MQNLSRFGEEENKKPQSQILILVQGGTCPEASDPVVLDSNKA